MIGHYELLTILPGTLTEEEAPAAAQKVHALLTDQGATIIKTEFWGKRKLAYEIDKLRQGYYDLVEFDADTNRLQNLDQALRLDDGVVRFQIVQRIIKTPEQLAAAKQLQERLAAKRQADKERETGAAMSAEPSKPTPPPAGQVSEEQLEEKLEEILESDKVDV